MLNILLKHKNIMSKIGLLYETIKICIKIVQINNTNPMKKYFMSQAIQKILSFLVSVEFFIFRSKFLLYYVNGILCSVT